MIKSTPIPYPFAPKTETLEVPKDWIPWWTEKGRFPVQVTVEPEVVVVAGSTYRLYPKGDGGFVAARKGNPTPVGTIYEYGVRETLTAAFFQELSAVRAVLYNKSYPAVLAYEMKDRTKVHPGPCFEAHPCTVIRKAQYTLTSTDERCSVCKERFL